MYYNVCNKYKKSKKTKTSNILKIYIYIYFIHLYNKYISIVYRKCGHEHAKNITIKKKKESVEILKIHGLINSIEDQNRIT